MESKQTNQTNQQPTQQSKIFNIDFNIYNEYYKTFINNYNEYYKVKLIPSNHDLFELVKNEVSKILNNINEHYQIINYTKYKYYIHYIFMLLNFNIYNKLVKINIFNNNKNMKEFYLKYNHLMFNGLTIENNFIFIFMSRNDFNINYEKSNFYKHLYKLIDDEILTPKFNKNILLFYQLITNQYKIIYKNLNTLLNDNKLYIKLNINVDNKLECYKAYNTLLDWKQQDLKLNKFNILYYLIYINHNVKYEYSLNINYDVKIISLNIIKYKNMNVKQNRINYLYN